MMLIYRQGQGSCLRLRLGLKQQGKDYEVDIDAYGFRGTAGSSNSHRIHL